MGDAIWVDAHLLYKVSKGDRLRVEPSNGVKRVAEPRCRPLETDHGHQCVVVERQWTVAVRALAPKGRSHPPNDREVVEAVARRALARFEHGER
jgi:hypothetical protein